MWFPTDVPSADPDDRVAALRRLRQAMQAERRRRRQLRKTARVGTVGLAVVVLVGVAPMGTGGFGGMLLGLADAVAEMPVPIGAPGRHWDARTESRELMSIPMGEGKVLEFLVTAVEESWHDAGDVPRRTRTYGAPVFFSAEDEDLFHAAGLAALYGDGSRVTVPLPGADLRFAVDRAVAEEAIAGTLRRRIAGLGNRQLEEVGLLRLAADLMLLHADDPVMRAKVLRVIADIPGIVVTPTTRRVMVSIDYVDGDRPLRLVYEFDADTAHLVGEYLAVLATRTEPATVVRSARHTLTQTPVGS